MSRQGGTSFVSSIFIHQLLLGLSLASYQYYNGQEKIQPSCYSKLACLLIKVLTIVRTCSGAPKERKKSHPIDASKQASDSKRREASSSMRMEIKKVMYKKGKKMRVEAQGRTKKRTKRYPPQRTRSHGPIRIWHRWMKRNGFMDWPGQT
jgi:hypothetical protein